MTLEQKQYEGKWVHCRHCAARRPEKDTRPTFHLVGAVMKRVFACVDQALCELLKAARR